ncbi:DNA-binding SARP family transcriptional activator [Kitasatospora sp. GAS204A]|uniref:AfsR/SARP family transcriptional regulator n=1 Tax=unclassified Kitasatospora TaxID=2633591 RepID=UPI002476012B|nr:BTAD domain-containing putative transcriptional regulator [Kitasatospora sp. GAS204B]MDH6116805.1 DNA-binding SARP family transcriptional activator [Kitasatospora sp. GAS204B]
MGIRLLGPVELRTGDGGLAEIAGAKRRAVLALLALELGQAVPVERFFELLWGEQPPAQAKAALQGHIAALRKVLDGTCFTLLTRSPGYQLDGDARSVDTRHFEALVTEAATTAHDAVAAALLQSALNLWGGPALADLPDTPLALALVDRLDGARVAAVESWAERLLRLGSGPQAIPALEQAVRADGLRESTVALLIRCLRQAGRNSAALAAYQHARTRLDEELGVSPGAALQAAADRLPATDGAPDAPCDVAAVAKPPRAGATLPGAGLAAAPRAHSAADLVGCRLPRRPGGFVGRGAEARWLDRECGADRTGAGLAVVVGPAGTGKTATVVTWAHATAPGFPDGLLFTDLRGFDPAGPTDPTQALGRFLHALGLPESAIPEDLAARAALFQERTRNRRLLVVLDNVRRAADVTPLLPAGPGCATVVTSRSTLEDLVVAEGAAVLRLEALAEEEAIGLLERLLTPARVRAERETAARLVELCDKLPLALRIAAARLTSRPGWTIADLVAELSDERTRLLALDTQGTASVTSALSLTYRHLPPDAAQLLGLLAAHPGTEVDALAAAALLGSGTGPARHALGALAAYHLLGENAPGRYGRHDLIRLFGAQLLAEQGEGGRRGASVRLLDYYLAAARAAAELVQPGGEISPCAIEHPPAALPRIVDVRSALAWFTAEEPTIRRLVTIAADQGEHQRAWRLAALSYVLYHGAARLTDQLSCLRSGLLAARRSGSRTALAALQALTASVLADTGRLEEARELVGEAVAGTSATDGQVHVVALVTDAKVRAKSGEIDQAVVVINRAVELRNWLGLGIESAGLLSNASALHGMAGQVGTALKLARQVRRLLADHPEATHHLSAMVNEAHALQSLGEWEAAEAAWQETLARCRSAGLLQLHAMTERQFAEFLLERGRPDDAAGHLRIAVELYTTRGELALAQQLVAQVAEVEALVAQPSGR